MLHKLKTLLHKTSRWGHEALDLKEPNTEWVLRNKDGWIKAKWSSHNTITNVGHAVANGLMSNQGAYGFALWLALGIGTQSAAGATALNSEITTLGGARAAGTASQVTTSVTNDTTQLVHTWTFTGSFAITEEGILTAITVGSLLAYQTFAAINVVSGDTLQVTHKYQT